MNKKLLLIYILFFFSVNAMAALESFNCTRVLNSNSSDKLRTHQSCNQLNASQHKLSESSIQQSDKLTSDGFTKVNINNKESKSGALTFILLIPVLLVFLFSGFKKSNK